MTIRREILETEHGVVLYPPITARPYYRVVWRDAHGAGQQASAGKDPEAAWAKAVSIDDELAAALADPTGRTVDALATAWLDDMRSEWSDLHYEKSESMAERFIRPQLGTVSAFRLEREEVSALLKSPTATSTKRHLRAAVGSMLTWGCENDWTAHPREFYMPRRAKTGERGAGRQHGESHQVIDPRLRPSADACRVLAEQLAAAAGEKHAEQAWLMVALSASCGVREGELWAARVSAFRLGAGEWFVDRQVVRPKSGGVKVTLPKWGGVRTTLIPDNTIWREPLLPRLTAYLAGKEPHELAFPAPRGGYFHPSNFSRDWLRPARNAAAPVWHAGWGYHALRHAFCTYMLDAGAGARDVAAAAGHRDSGVTLAMYVGQTQGTIGRLREAAARNHEPRE